MNEVWELGGVTNEEHGSVVEHPVEVALLGAELDREAARVAGGVGGPGLTTDGGEAHSGAGAVADLGEELGAGEVGDVVSDFEVTVCAGALGVDL